MMTGLIEDGPRQDGSNDGPEDQECHWPDPAATQDPIDEAGEDDALPPGRETPAWSV